MTARRWHSGQFMYEMKSFGQWIEMLPVWHSDDEAVNTEPSRRVDHLFQRRNQDVAAFESEPLFRRIFLSEKLFEVGGAQQSLHQSSLFMTLELHDAWRLEALPDPVTLLQIVDVHVLQADMFTVDLLAAASQSPSAFITVSNMLANYSAKNSREIFYSQSCWWRKILILLSSFTAVRYHCRREEFCTNDPYFFSYIL